MTRSKGEKNMKKILNAFSINMLKMEEGCEWIIMFKPLPFNLDEIKKFIKKEGLKSFIGHTDLAEMLEVTVNRESAVIEDREEIFIAQFIGHRLPEGTKILPENAEIKLIQARCHKIKL